MKGRMTEGLPELERGAGLAGRGGGWPHKLQEEMGTVTVHRICVVRLKSQ